MAIYRSHRPTGGVRNEIRRGTAFGLSAAILILLVLSVAAQVWAFPSAVSHFAEIFPEIQPIAGTSVVWGVIAIALLQLVALVCLQIIRLARVNKSHESIYRWLWVVAAMLAAFAVLTGVTLFMLEALDFLAPGIMLGLIGAGLSASIAAGAIALRVGTRR